MKLEFPSFAPWFEECRRITSAESDYDDIHVFTGEEGSGKSKDMRVIFPRLDPTFSVDRIHFTQDDFLNQLGTLEPGQAIVLDEFRGHKRMAMHGDRLEMLDTLKEIRGLRLHVGIGFPHVTQLEGDILYQRIRWWNHIPRRGELLVHRRIANVRTGKDGKPVVDVRFPLAARLPVPKETPDPMGTAYYQKKDARMRDRVARYKEALGGKTPVTEKFPMPGLQEAFAALPPVKRLAGDTGSTRFPPALLDQVAADIKKAMQ
jgi:hypothetical protein